MVAGAVESLMPGKRELKGRVKGEIDSKISSRNSLSEKIKDRSDSIREMLSI